MSKVLLEYIWIDAYNNTRSKVKIHTLSTPSTNTETELLLSDIPEWNYDGSSTGQAIGSSSDIIIKPVQLYPNPFYNISNVPSYLVLCDTYDKENKILESNKRVHCAEVAMQNADKQFLFGLEQEYIMIDNNNPEKPYNWSTYNRPDNSDSYCSAGADRCYGRALVDKHLEYCLKANINICGINAEVMTSQWEFQIGCVDALQVSDDLWTARYILTKLAEEFNCVISFHPKPFAHFSGSGLHTNVSTIEMRSPGGLTEIENIEPLLRQTHSTSKEIYGNDNNLRLTGNHETCSIDEFKIGVRDRGCSIRIPLSVYNNKCGYFEDRRPASNANPYEVTAFIMKSLMTFKTTNNIFSKGNLKLFALDKDTTVGELSELESKKLFPYQQSNIIKTPTIEQVAEYTKEDSQLHSIKHSTGAELFPLEKEPVVFTQAKKDLHIPITDTEPQYYKANDLLESTTIVELGEYPDKKIIKDQHYKLTFNKLTENKSCFKCNSNTFCTNMCFQNNISCNTCGEKVILYEIDIEDMKDNVPFLQSQSVTSSTTDALINPLTNAEEEIDPELTNVVIIE